MHLRLRYDPMRMWFRWKTGIRLGWCLVGVGILPLLIQLGWNHSHKLTALLAPVDLTKDFTSQTFKTDLNEIYQIDIYSLARKHSPLNVDWKVIDTAGIVIAGATYREQQVGGSRIRIGEYRATRGLRQKLVLQNRGGAQSGVSSSVVQVWLPERALESAQIDSLLVVGWAVLLMGCGIAVVVITALLRSEEREVRES